MNVYEHWDQCQLKTKTHFIHWGEHHWLLVKASVNGCNLHWVYTSVVHTGKSTVSTVEHCVCVGCCSRLDCLLSPHATSDWTLHTERNTVQSVFLDRGIDINVKVLHQMCMHMHSITQKPLLLFRNWSPINFSRFTGRHAIRLDK